MNYSTWAEQAKKKLSKLSDSELDKIANSSETDAAVIATEILAKRKGTDEGRG